MLSIEAVKRQIDAVQSMEAVTQAFEQSAASAMRRTRERIIGARAFAEETWRLYGILRQIVREGPEVSDRDLVIVITLNGGMAGGLLTKVLAVAERVQGEKKADTLITGKKGHGRFQKKDGRTVHFFSLPNEVEYSQLEPLKKIVSGYAAVHVVFPRYYGANDQRVEVVSLVARKKDEPSAGAGVKKILSANQFRIEPDIPRVVEYFSKEVTGIMIYSYFGEAQLAYNAAQMLAMRSARDNAEKERKRLMFLFHRARRERIDTKLREVLRAKPAGGSR